MGERKDRKFALSAQDRGGCRRETVHRMTRRCAGWDYRQRAIYPITLVQADRRRPALGRLVIDDPKAPPEAVAAHVEPSALGAAVLAHVRRLGDFAPEVKPLFCQLMPDHLHLIVEVTRPMAKPLGHVIGGFKTGCEKIYRELRGSRLWAPGFQDSILFRAGRHRHDEPRLHLAPGRAVRDGLRADRAGRRLPVA